MAQDTKIDVLRRVPLFAKLGNRELERIAQLAEQIQVGLDQHLTEQGRLGDEFFVVAAGHLTVLEDGKPVRQLHPGDFFGEIALLEGHVRTATVRADGIAELLAIGHPQFLSLMDEFPTVREAIEATAAERRGVPEADAS